MMAFLRAMDAGRARELALAMPQAEEYDHFGKPAYRFMAKAGTSKAERTFMTLWVEEQRAVFMLNAEQQADLHSRHPEVFFPVPNKWGAKGATFVELRQANDNLFQEGLDVAHAWAGR